MLMLRSQYQLHMEHSQTAIVQNLNSLCCKSPTANFCCALPVGRAEVAAPGFALRTGFAGAIAHYFSVYVFEVLKPNEGLALITTVYVVHGLLSDLLKQPLDWTHPVAVVAHTIANVPMPGQLPASKQTQNKPSKQRQPAQSISNSTTDIKKDK